MLDISVKAEGEEDRRQLEVETVKHCTGQISRKDGGHNSILPCLLEAI